MIQSAQVASKFTLFTHHAKTFPNLVTALRNSMLRAGVFKDEKTAEEQVVQVLNFDIHLLKDFRGRRFIERITECVPIEEKNEYTFDHRKEKTLEGKLDKFMDNATIFFSKTTNRELYKHHNVLEFVDDRYVLTNPISEYNIKEMRNNMDDTDVVKFDAFLERNWGIKPPKMPGPNVGGEASLEEPKATAESTVPVSATPTSRSAVPQRPANPSAQSSSSRPQVNPASSAVKRNIVIKKDGNPVAPNITRPENKESPVQSKKGVSSILGGVELNNNDDDENKKDNKDE